MKLYISDLDGTLLNNEMMLSEETIEIINSLLEKGLNFTFATARSMDSVEKITNPLKLNLPFVIYNGGAIYDPKKEKYIRIGSNNKKLSEFPEKERLLWEKLSSINYEEKIAISNINQEELFNLLDISSYYSLLKKNIPEMNTKVISDFLRNAFNLLQDERNC